MRTGIQFTGTLPANAQGRWFSHSWSAEEHIIWTVVPTSIQRGNPQVDWDVAVERAASNKCTYWITIKNLTNRPVTFEGRYAIM